MQARGVKDKARSVGDVLQLGVFVKVLVVVILNMLRYAAEYPSHDRADIDRLRRHTADGLRALLVEVKSEAIGVKAQILPIQRQCSAGNGAARHAGDPVELRQVFELVQAPECSQVKQHSAIASSGKTKRDAFRGLLGIIGMIVNRLKRGQHWLIVGHDTSELR